VPKADILHRSNNAGLLGRVLPIFRQQFSFDTYFFPPASGKIHMATIMKAAVASTKFPNSGPHRRTAPKRENERDNSDCS